MKILDGKGCLFGKINIIDFGIILLLLIVIPGFFRVYTILGKRPTRVPAEWIKVKAVTFAIPEIAELFGEDDLTYDPDGNQDGKLLEISKKGEIHAENMKSTVPDKTGDEKYGYMKPVFLNLELLCTFSETRGNWYYKRTPLAVGFVNKFCFATDKYTIDCYPLKIGD